MQTLLLAGMILLPIGAGVMSARLWFYKKQIHHMREELSLLQNADTNYQLTSAVPIGRTEELISEINHLTARYREERRLLLRENRIYKESITSISHDIRTPLTSVKGYVQLQTKADISEEKKAEYLRIVERRLEELGDMLNQLFEYARLEAGEFQLNLQRINAGNSFAETISLFYEDFTVKGLEPQVEVCSKPIFIQADSHAFSRILENLIKNALVHGKGDYRFSLTSEESYAVIVIANETEQIEEKDLQQIFERFYTTDQSRNRRTTGLGLAIAKEFTEQMGGRIEAFLQEGCFRVEVRLPLSDN